MNDLEHFIPKREALCGARPWSQSKIKQLTARIYDEIFVRLERADLRGVVEHRITAMYGPPIANPDLMLVSFQGRAGDNSPSERTWPEKLRYLDSDYDFGRTLQSQFREAGL